MPRLVRFEALSPIKIDPATWPRDEQGNLKPISVCACGLSQKYPICDGAHKPCRVSEQPGVLYVYDATRTKVIEERPDV